MKSVLKVLTVVMVAIHLAGPAVAQVHIVPAGGAAAGASDASGVPLIAPSEAVAIALDTVPSAKPLGVQLRGSSYVVKLKQGNKVMQIRVDAETGAVQ
jgi:hypothetical protein